MKYILLLPYIISFVFSVAAGSTSSYDTPSEYNYSVVLDYDCTSTVLRVSVTNLEGKDLKYGVIPAKDEFSILVLKDGFGVASGTTDTEGKASFSLYDDGRYLVRVKKEKYFEKESLIAVRKCTVRELSYYCTQEKTMRERVACVLKLPDEVVQAVQYLPEECRVLSETPVQEKCVADYKVLQSCRGSKTTDQERETCIRPKLKLQSTTDDTLASCNAKSGTSKRLCLLQVRESIFTLAKFRLYNLVYKAYQLYEQKRVSESDLIDFTILINEKKIAFNDAETLGTKKQVLFEAQVAWEVFKKKVQEEPS